jgi:NDP-sugar pyrophosphorylase family protein
MTVRAGDDDAAVVLAGGLGTRLRPLTATIPKPLLPIGNQPILEVLLQQLRRDGISRVRLCVGHLATFIQAYFRDGEALGVTLDYLVEREPLGTAGALRVLAHLPREFLMINGDTLTDIDFRSLLDTHRRSGAAITAFTPLIEDHIDFGVLDLNEETGAIVAYHEKPRNRFFVSSGIYALSRSVVDLVPAGRFDMPELVTRALERGLAVQSFRSGAYWRDIGRPADYEHACRDFEADPQRFLKPAGAAVARP